MNLLDGLAAFFDLAVVRAALLLVLAFVAATVARMLARRLIDGTRLRTVLAKADETAYDEAGTARNYLGQLAYLLVFLLFVPGIFTALGVDAAATPLLSMLGNIWGYLPNVLAAGIILVVGMIVARVARQLAAPLLERLGADSLQERVGIKVTGDARLSTTLAYVVYALIAIPVVIMALQALGISAITDPAVAMLGRVLAFVPNVVVALLMVGVGSIVARMAAQLVERLLATTGIDARVAEMTGDGLRGLTVSGIVAGAVRIVANIFFAVEALDVIRLGVLADIGAAVISYLPNVVAAVAIALLATLAARAAATALRGAGLGGYALPAQAGVAVVAAFMVLSQLGIATAIVNAAFVALIAAVAVAGAIAFGLGGREAAARALGRWGAGAEEAAGRVREAVGRPDASASPSHDLAEKGLDGDGGMAGADEGRASASEEAWNAGFAPHGPHVADAPWAMTHAGVDTASHAS